MSSIASTLELRSLPIYLGAQTAWTREKHDERREIWRHESGARVFVPAIDGPDLADLLGHAAATISKAEQRSHDDVLADLLWYRFDKLHLRRDAPGNSLGLEDGLGLHGAFRDVILASAQAARDPRRSYLGGRRAQDVDAYLEDVRLIPSVPGSFVLRALLPLTIDETGGEIRLPLVGPAATEVRRVSTTVLAATHAATTTALQVAQGGSLDLWTDSVAAGVSSNLCDALSRLTGEGDEGSDAEIQISWTWAAPQDVAGPVGIARGLAPVLAAGGDFLRDVSDDRHIRMVGLVTKLHRASPKGPGEITVAGHIEGWEETSRSLRLPLDERTYHEAIAAHDRGQSVRVSATVRRNPTRRFEVLEVEDLRVIADS